MERTLFLNGTIAEESWFDDDVTPQLFKDELMSGSGDITEVLKRDDPVRWVQEMNSVKAAVREVVCAEIIDVG